MEIKSKITPAVIQAASAMLSPYVPEISPTGLVAALKEYNVTKTEKQERQKPLTRFEVAELLGLSVQTINRMMNRGTLRRIHVGLRSVRIDPASVTALLDGAAAPASVSVEG